MKAIRAHFDGKQILIPDTAMGLPPGQVIVVFDDGEDEDAARVAWMRNQEQAFAKVWDNDEDAAYDSL